jgi:hypothetical protein
MHGAVGQRVAHYRVPNEAGLSKGDVPRADEVPVLRLVVPGVFRR